MKASIESDPERFLFRDLYPGLSVGTASDRYAGWIGQIYSKERYAPSSRVKRVGRVSFQERVLPVESVEEYFRHFEVLEVDFTFYAPLLDKELKPSRTFHTLRAYRDHLVSGARLILKAPQAVFARKLRRGMVFVKNPDYLDADLFTQRFYEPAEDLLGEHLVGILFEQEYQKKEERVDTEIFASELERFFDGCPEDPRYHVEVRTEAYLARPLFEVLARKGIGQVLSHWTWLPPLRDQLQKAGGRFFNRGGHCVVRLMTPPGVRYEEAYKQAFPFDRLVDGMLSPGMIEDASLIAVSALQEDVHVNMVVNNRAGGNAPLIARKFARSFLQRISVKS